MREISISDIADFKIGNAQDILKGTGCTVIICENGAAAGVDVRGGGPATRETDLLRPENMVQAINAVTISGGSSFGLEAADGVMQYLREKNIGFETGFGVVPIVCGASLFDLVSGDNTAYPDKQMGYEACKAAQSGTFRQGNFGAGTGATVGKLMGIERLMKGGLGAYAVSADGLEIGAVVAVNALGDIFDTDTGRQLAGLLSEDKTGLASTEQAMFDKINTGRDVFKGNTTIGCVITNADINKPQCCKIASVTHDGFARAIKPVHSSADGDSIFVMASGRVAADFDTVGALSAYVMSRAIRNAVMNAESAYGYKCAKDFLK